YARVKGWPLQRVIVTIRHDKIYARDCAECETREGRIDRLEREIVLEGPLEEAQKERLLEIAERCPVHRTLTREMQLVTRLKKPCGQHFSRLSPPVAAARSPSSGPGSRRARTAPGHRRAQPIRAAPP